MNNQNQGAFQPWGGGGGHPQQQQLQPQQSQLQQQHHNAANNNNQLYQQMQQQLFQQQQGGGGNILQQNNQMVGQWDQQQNNNFQLPHQLMNNNAAVNTIHNNNQGQNAWMQQAQMQQQNFAPTSHTNSNQLMNNMNMMWGAGDSGQGGMGPPQQQQQQQPQQQNQQLYWNALQSQQQQSGGTGGNEWAMPQQNNNNQQQLQQSQHLPNQQQHQQTHQSFSQGMMQDYSPQQGGVAVGNDQGLQQFFPQAAQQQQQQQQQQPDQSSSSQQQQQQSVQSQAQMLLHQQNLISQLQLQIQEQAHLNPAHAHNLLQQFPSLQQGNAAGGNGGSSSAAASSSIMGIQMQQQHPSQQVHQQHQSQMNNQQNNQNEQLMMLMAQQQQSQLGSRQVSTGTPSQQQQPQLQSQSSVLSQTTQPQQLMQQQQQWHSQLPQQQLDLLQQQLGNNNNQNQYHGHQQQQQHQQHTLNQNNKSIANDDLTTFASLFVSSNNDLLTMGDDTSTQQQERRRSSTSATPVITNQRRAAQQQPQQQQQANPQNLMIPQMLLQPGNINMGGGGGSEIPQNLNFPNFGDGGGGGSATNANDDSDGLSLDHRVKQFEVMQNQHQQQQVSSLTQQKERRTSSIGSIGDDSAATQPPGDKLQLPSQIRSTAEQVQPESVLQQNEQQRKDIATTVADNSDGDTAHEPQSLLGPPRVASPVSLGVAEPDPIVDGATIIRSAGAINVIAPTRHKDGGANDESGAPTSSSGGDHENGSEQAFLDGHFAGGWQSNVDLPDRRQIIFSIIKVIERKRPDTNRMSQNRLPLMAKKLEEHLYRSAHLKDAYVDLASLKKRLHLIAKGVGIEKSNTPSVCSIGSQSSPSLVFQTSSGRNSMYDNNATPESIANQFQPLAATSQGSNLSVEMNQNEALPSMSKERAPKSLKVADTPECEKKTGKEDAGVTGGSEVDCTNKSVATASSTEKGGDSSNSEKKKVVLHQQQRRLLLLRHASKCTEGTQCVVKFCPQMVTLWKHMKTCRDKNCKAAHCLSSRCVLNHYRICKSEGLTSSCAICAPVMKHIRMKEGDEGSMQSQNLQELDQMSEGNMSVLDPFDDMTANVDVLQEDEQESSDSFKALKDALVSDVPNAPTETKVVLESEIQFQETGKSKSSTQNTGKKLQDQDEKRKAEDMDGEKEVSRPNKIMKHQSSTASVNSDASATKKSSSLIPSMQITDIEAHLDSLVKKGQLTPRSISRKCLPIVKRLCGHENGWIFTESVDPIELGIPDYFDVVEHPMDLDLVTKKLENGVYWDIQSFRKDTRLVFENAILYNGKDSDVGMMAKELLDIFEEELSNCLKGLNFDLNFENEAKKADSCSLCGNHRRQYELPSLFCSGSCGTRNIRRNAIYYTDRMKQNQWCEPCYGELKDDTPLQLDNGKVTKKAHLQQLKNDKSPEEKWVQCDNCQDWVHQVCALYNGAQNYKSASFTCPKCHIKSEASKTPIPGPKGAADLPHCKLSESIEKGIANALSKAYEKIAQERNWNISQVEKVENLYVRVVSSLNKKQKVRDGMKARYSKNDYPSEFPVRTKCILLFQKIHGVDVLLFAMYVYEYGDECPNPNRRRVYISYLDSVRYLSPAQYRTTIYQSVVIEYLRFVKMRGFHTAHIWSCPPAKGDEYIFYCHPVNQLTPRNDMLCTWYNDTLQKAKEAGVVLDIRSLYDDYFKDNVVNRKTGEPFDPTHIPYFDGDYIPGEIEKIIKDVENDDARREGTKLKDSPSKVASAPSKTEGKRSGTRSNPGKLVNQDRDKVMNRLDLVLARMKENFFVVQLLSNDFIDAVEDKNADISSWVEGGASDDHSDNSSKSTRSIGKNPYILDMKDAAIKDAKATDETDALVGKQVIAVSTKDEDPLVEQECFETRLQFLNYCQRNNYQFDELRRAKYSSTMVLAYLHNPREEKEQQIKAHLEVIAHAASCQGCVSKNCQRMKQLFGHVRGCELTYKRGCKSCSRLFMLLVKHARDCSSKGACPIPFCNRIKERNEMLHRQQQLMDDRRRDAQNCRAKDSDSTS